MMRSLRAFSRLIGTVLGVLGLASLMSAPPPGPRLRLPGCGVTVATPTGFKRSSAGPGWLMLRGRGGAQLILNCTPNARRTTLVDELGQRFRRRGRVLLGFRRMTLRGSHRAAVYVLVRKEAGGRSGRAGHAYVATRLFEYRAVHIPGQGATGIPRLLYPLEQLLGSLRLMKEVAPALTEAAYRRRLYGAAILMALLAVALTAFGIRRRRRRNAMRLPDED